MFTCTREMNLRSKSHFTKNGKRPVIGQFARTEVDTGWSSRSWGRNDCVTNRTSAWEAKKCAAIRRNRNWKNRAWNVCLFTCQSSNDRTPVPEPAIHLDCANCQQVQMDRGLWERHVMYTHAPVGAHVPITTGSGMTWLWLIVLEYVMNRKEG